MVYIIYIMKTAKVFYSGRSQAVRLPKEFRFRDNEVSIRRDGEAVILEPIKKGRWPDGFWRKNRVEDAGFRRVPQGGVPGRPAFDGDV